MTGDARFTCECGWSGPNADLVPDPYPGGPGHCPACAKVGRLVVLDGPERCPLCFDTGRRASSAEDELSRRAGQSVRLVACPRGCPDDR